MCGHIPIDRKGGMKPPVCKFCKVAEWRHVCGGVPVASNKAEMSASNRKKRASNTASNKHQRWDKKAYNAYMRMYMAVKRAVGAGRADWWPRRGNQA